MGTVKIEKACKDMAKARKRDSASLSAEAMKGMLELLGLDSITVTCLRCGEEYEVKDTSIITDLGFYWSESGQFMMDHFGPCTKGSCEGMQYGSKSSAEVTE